MLKYPIGEYRKRVILEVKSEAAGNEFNESPITWSTAATHWARVAELDGREFEDSKQWQAKRRLQVNLRYYAGLNSSGYRVRYGTRIFGIDSVLDIAELHQEHELICVEKA